MGQQANSGRNASLDQKKRRAAGRQQHAPDQEAINDYIGPAEPRRQAGSGIGKSATPRQRRPKRR